MPACEWTGKKGFTLVELMTAVVVIAVGMVFVLGAFNQCVTAQATAQKTLIAAILLDKKLWEDDEAIKASLGTVDGETLGVFEPPYQNFNWTRVVRDGISAEVGNASLTLGSYMNEEVFGVTWFQGKAVRDVSVTRYVLRKR